MSSPVLITKEEVQILNAARTVLLDIDIRAGKAAVHPEEEENGYPLGRLAATCYAAHGLVYSALNIAQTYCGVELTDAQLHNNPPEVLTLSKPRPRSVTIHDDNGKEAHA